MRASNCSGLFSGRGIQWGIITLLAFVLLGCASRPGPEVLTPVAASPGVKTLQTYVATTRARESSSENVFTANRANALNFAKFTVSVPPNHKPGNLEMPTATPDPLNPCSIAWSGVYWRAVGGLGQTQTCRISGTETILSFSIVLNSGANFYTGTGTPGTGQYDALSVATHEFGHAAGLGHFADTDPSTCNPAGGRLYDNTMCGALPVRFTTWRSLELHDRHTFQAAYPY